MATDGLGHLVQTRLGVRHAHRLAQGRHVTIAVAAGQPQLCAQLDGEPWQLPGSGATLRLQLDRKCSIVKGPGTLLGAHTRFHGTAAT